MEPRNGHGKKRKFRHSSNFYRKVKLQLNSVSDANNLNAPNNGSDHRDTLPNLVLKEPISVSENECNEQYLSTNVSEDISLVDYHQNDRELFLPEIDDVDEESENGRTTAHFFEENMINWCLKYRVSHKGVNELLGYLRMEGYPFPKDSRTFLSTPGKLNIVDMGTGEFWYYGIKNCILDALSNISNPILMTTLSLIFNIDGMPPFKSSSFEFWPILMRISDMNQLSPKPVAIYCGPIKPPLQEFFAQFVDEMKVILAEGILWDGNTISINIKYFVCDTPARNYVKGTVGFNAAHGCIKCTTIGEFDKKARHMSFPNITCPKRTNENFRQKTDKDHHKEDTPLLSLPIDMCDTFIVADSLHLIDLGVTRKCLNGWINGSYNFRSKLSANQKELLSDILLQCNNTKPDEIHRSIRKLKHLKFWKGSEYRTFLHYIGPVVLKQFLLKDTYEHFLTLFSAVTIVSSNEYHHYLPVAEQLFKDYIGTFIALYGRDSISSNIHNLCHVVEDVKNVGNLTEISTYPFENFLRQIKLLLRHGNRPLAQVVKRTGEILKHSRANSHESSVLYPFVDNEDKRVIRHQLFSCKKIFNRVHVSNKFVLSNNKKNKWFLTTSGEIVGMINATYFKDQIHIYGGSVKTKYDFFTKPIKSSSLNVYLSDAKTSSLNLYSLEKIKCKLFSVPYKDQQMVFFPLIHTYI